MRRHMKTQITKQMYEHFFFFNRYLANFCHIQINIDKLISTGKIHFVPIILSMYVRFESNFPSIIK